MYRSRAAGLLYHVTFQEVHTHRRTPWRSERIYIGYYKVVFGHVFRIPYQSLATIITTILMICIATCAQKECV